MARIIEPAERAPDALFANHVVGISIRDGIAEIALGNASPVMSRAFRRAFFCSSTFRRRTSSAWNVPNLFFHM
jgi:hypothetical protein